MCFTWRFRDRTEPDHVINLWKLFQPCVGCLRNTTERAACDEASLRMRSFPLFKLLHRRRERSCAGLCVPHVRWWLAQDWLLEKNHHLLWANLLQNVFVTFLLMIGYYIASHDHIIILQSSQRRRFWIVLFGCSDANSYSFHLIRCRLLDDSFRILGNISSYITFALYLMIYKDRRRLSGKTHQVFLRLNSGKTAKQICTITVT